MTPLGLTVMRRSATLLHAVPGLRARIVHEGRTLLEVLRPCHPGDAPAGRWITPCAFHAAVGRAVAAHRAGRTLAVLGLPAGVDPTVEIGARHGALLAGGIAELATPAGIELGFATTLRPDVVVALASEPADAKHIDVRPHHDPLTDATLVVHTVHALEAARDEALDRVQRLLARCAVEELVDDVGAFLRLDAPAATTEREARGAPEA